MLLSDDQIDELSSAINMKLGHKLKFAVILQEARVEIKREKAKRERQEEEREREEEEQKELEHELSKIERKRILRDAEARSTRDADNNEHADAKPKATETTENNKATDPAQYQATPLPAWKEFSAFISHKKMHTQFADSSETLSIRLKVHEMMDVCVGMYSHCNSCLCLARIC